jgi:hypothetical protein
LNSFTDFCIRPALLDVQIAQNGERQNQTIAFAPQLAAFSRWLLGALQTANPPRRR